MRTVRLEGGTPGIPKQRDRDTYLCALIRKDKIYAIKIELCSRGLGKAERRIKQLQTGCPDRLKLLAVARGNQERKLHREFAGFRMPIGEYFRPAQPILELIRKIQTINDLVSKLERHKI